MNTTAQAKAQKNKNRFFLVNCISNFINDQTAEKQKLLKWMKRVQEEEAGQGQEAKPEAIKNSKRLRLGEDDEERCEEEGVWNLLSGLPYVILHQLLGYLSTHRQPLSAPVPSMSVFNNISIFIFNYFCN
jgi:hypothetical protein